MADPSRPQAAFWGKEMDHSGSGLAMLLASAGHDRVPHVHCVTGRPVALRVPAHCPRDWLTPLVPAWEAIERGLRLCGTGFNSWVLKGTNDERRERLLEIWRKIGGRPLLCGPLDPAKLWNRYESRYSSLPAAFVLIIDIDRRGDAILHDPEGVAFLERPLDILLAGLQAPTQQGLFAIGAGSSIHPPQTIAKKAFQQALRLRVENCAGTVGAARGLRRLAEVLRKEPLAGSRMEAARIGLAFAGRCAASLASLAEDNDAREGQAACTEYARAAALAQQALVNTESDAACEAFAHLAELEDAIDGLMAPTNVDRHRIRDPQPKQS